MLLWLHVRVQGGLRCASHILKCCNLQNILRCDVRCKWLKQPLAWLILFLNIQSSYSWTTTTDWRTLMESCPQVCSELYSGMYQNFDIIVDTMVSFINHFWCPMGVTIWTIGNGGQYASDGRTIKIFAQNLVDHGSTKIPYFDDFPF